MDRDGDTAMDVDIDIVGSDEDIAIIGRDDVDTYNEDNILPESPSVIAKLRAWLEPTPYDLPNGEYRRHLASHAEGTGEWLTSTASYQEWHDGREQGLLWIRGIPGSGKSVFAATLANQLAEEGHPVLYFFFRQIIDANHKPGQLLRDWLDQIIEYSPPLQRELKAYMDSSGSMYPSIQSFGMDTLWKHLKTALSHMQRVYLVADALDEMDTGNDEFLQTLARLGSWKPAQVKVLITSRPVSSVEVPLREAKASMLHVRLEERFVDLDIATFVERALGTSSSITPDQQTLIKAAVPGRANGLFLYAKLAMDAFLEPGANVQQVLEALPADLNTMYTDLLQEHRRRSGVPDDIQLLILSWVTHATHPLRLLEMAEIILVTYDKPEGIQRDIKAAKDLVRTACGPLLEILPDETVSVVHHSFTEYLRGSTRSAADSASFPILDPGQTHERLALSCLKYLRSGCLDASMEEGDDWTARDREDERRKEYIARRLEFPFFEYAVKEWSSHCEKSFREGRESEDLMSALKDFLTPGVLFDAWLRQRPSRHFHRPAPLHVVAHLGLAPYVRFIVKNPETQVDIRDASGRTPVHYAAERGHDMVVKALIEAGANPDQDDESGQKPLHLAALWNHPGVVRVLIEAGVDAMTPKTGDDPRGECVATSSTHGYTALRYAVERGSHEALEALLPSLDVKQVQVALAWAVTYRSPWMVELLVRHPGVNVNAKVRGATALFIACSLHDLGSMEILLNAGADVLILNRDSNFNSDAAATVDDVADDDSGTMSHLDVFLRGCEPGERKQRGLHLLLQAEAKASKDNRFGGRQQSLLRHAEDTEMVRLLLEAGADPNAEDDDGGTLLHIPRRLGNGWAIVKLLIEEAKLDINKRRGRDGRTPLMLYLDDNRNLHAEALKLIEEYGADCSMADHRGTTCLHILAANFNTWTGTRSLDRRATRARLLEIASKLVARGADVNKRDNQGQAPIHFLKSADAVKHFVGLGADIEAKDGHGNTILRIWFQQTRAQSSEMIRNELQELVKLGARLGTRDFKGRTLVHESVTNGNSIQAYGPNSIPLRLTALLHLGLSLVPKIVDYSGNTLLHELADAIGRGCYEQGLDIFSHLIQAYGFDPDMPNNAGQTALHRLCMIPAKNYQFGAMDTLDSALPLFKKIDAPDYDGIRPIHLASSISERRVWLLMGAGIDISTGTNGGLTPLHFAAKAGQSNIVGMLLGGLKAKHRAEGGSQSFTIDARDEFGRSPLYYACMSGRPETVELLLEAGASVTPNLLEACAKFQIESSSWTESNHGCDGSNRPPTNLINSERDTTRLEEILDMLTTRGGLGNAPLQAAIHTSNQPGVDYLRACLLNLQVDRPKSQMADPPSELLLDRWATFQAGISARAFVESGLIDIVRGDVFEQNKLFQLLLFKRQFGLLELAFSQGLDPCLHAPESLYRQSESTDAPLAVLVKFGYSRLLSRIADKRHIQKLADVDWILSKEDVHGFHRAHSLVMDACLRELPNMAVLRFLVEELGCSADDGVVDHRRVWPGADESSVEKQWISVIGYSPLHAVAEGKHWWQAHQALPYLIAQGADPSARTSRGVTPLHVALQTASIFQTHIVKTLVEGGADVNAVNSDGLSCLAVALDHPSKADLVKLLISKGAHVDPSVLYATVNKGDASLLECFLQSGVNSENMLQALERQPREHMGGANLLFHAAASQVPNREDIVRMLLAHGANPLAKFDCETWQNEYGSRAPRAGHLDSDLESERFTVLHQVIRTGNGCLEPFFELPASQFDIDCRNDEGNTALLVVCDNPVAFDRFLTLRAESAEKPRQLLIDLVLQRNPDLTAVDKRGRTALHLALHQWGNTPTSVQPLKVLLTAAHAKHPELINQTEPATGRTPLLCAIYMLIESWPLHPCDADKCASHKIKLLLDSFGADPHIPDGEGNTALHYVASCMDWNQAARALFSELLSLGLDVNARNSAGETPVFSLLRSERAVGARREQAQLIVSDEDEEAVWRLLEDAGTDFTATNNEGRGLLHVAAEDRRRARLKEQYISGSGMPDETLTALGPGVARFQRLMGKGLDPAQGDNSMRSALDVASACNNFKLLELFEKEPGKARLTRKPLLYLGEFDDY
ncbi:ankyrin-2 [Cladorrhinum samala]|uniref:Ankyrin-2 n=1 Tax=Cladorrhinum samala TaxID=585594 RepID=A0AAV9HW67_9PEZI|nr:ankyrin-2 [Cladorrhinum samala]